MIVGKIAVLEAGFDKPLIKEMNKIVKDENNKSKNMLLKLVSK